MEKPRDQGERFIFYLFNYFKMETFSYNTDYLPTVIAHVRASSLHEESSIRSLRFLPPEANIGMFS